MDRTELSSLFVDYPPALVPTRPVVGRDERERRQRAFLQSLIVFSSSLDRSAFRILAQHGVDSSRQALRIIGDASVSKLLLYPSTTPLYLNRGDKSCVTINVTTAKWLAASATSFSELEESDLLPELETIEQNKARAVLGVVVSLDGMLGRARLSSDDPDYFELNDAEIALLVPAIRFLVEVLKSEHDLLDHLVFSIGAHLATSAPALAVQVGFDVRGSSSLVDYPGYAEFARLVSEGVQRCHKGWAMTNPFIKASNLIALSRSPRTTSEDDLEAEPKRAKTVGRMRSADSE